MPRERLEVADIFRAQGPAWRRANRGHLSLGQLKVMSAIERCRTAALGGHMARCEDCAHTQIAYNSCRNRHCPKCQGGAAREWLAAREAELLEAPYYHVVFTLPAPIGDIAYQNKAVIYGILFKAAAETLITIAADPKHLGARIGLTAVMHSWGSALTHHPHVHCIVPGGGISLACPGQRSGGERWVACLPGFFLPVRVLSRLFRRLLLEQLVEAHAAGALQFFGDHAPLADPRAFADHLRPLRKIDWVVYAKRPFAGPRAVLAYLARYTHRVAIANNRLVAFDGNRVTFKWKDYRAQGRARYKTMTVGAHEFIRRFLIHVLPSGFHRIRHYGLFANGSRAENLARARELLGMPDPVREVDDAQAIEAMEPPSRNQPCPCCGGRRSMRPLTTRQGPSAHHRRPSTGNRRAWPRTRSAHRLDHHSIVPKVLEVPSALFVHVAERPAPTTPRAGGRSSHASRRHYPHRRRRHRA
jgi:hypothetical protein